MSKASPIIVGLDIGTTKIAAIAGRKNEFGKLEILGYGRAESSGVEHGMVMNLDQCIRSINIAIDNCLMSNPNLLIKEVYVGIAGHHIKSLQTRGERVRGIADDIITKDDIDALIKDQFKTYIPTGDQIIDIIPQDYTIDGIANIVSPKGRTGVKIGANFHIITGDKNAIKNIYRCVEHAQLKTKDLVLQPLASAAAVMSAEELEAGVAIVDIGGGTTDLAVFYDGILKHTAVIPFAGTNITNDIRQGLNVLKGQAEQLKLQFGCAIAAEAPQNEFITIPGIQGASPRDISRKNLANIIQARMEEILEYVLFHLKQINLHNKLAGGVILTGGGSQLAHLKQLTEYMLGCNARLGQPNEHLAGGYDKELDKPIYATCIGLILRGIDDFENDRLRFSSPNAMMGGDNSFFKVDANGTMSEAENEVETTSQENEVPEENNTTPSAEQVKKISMLENFEKRKVTIGKIFANVKTKILGMFEEVDDKDLDNDKDFN
jgi:cell division protein FtsA